MAIIFMYILPIVLALQLNSYLFDKKGVDFVASMPLSRKSLFWVHYTIGAVFILAMLCLTTIVIGIVCALHPLLVIDSIILVTSFITLLVGYMFVYSVSYFSLMTTGHQLTAALLAFAMMFLLSQIHIDISGDRNFIYPNTTNGFTVHNGVASYDTTKAIGDSIITATPIYILNDGDTINPFQIMLTIGETAIYTGLAYVIFMKRKLEVAQTSYIKTTSHNIAKGVILFFPAFYLIRLIGDVTFIDFFILLMLAAMYIIAFVYDSVTDRARASLLKSSISFVAIFTIVFVYIIAIGGVRWLMVEANLFGKRYFTQNEVESITIQMPSKINPSAKEITISEEEFIGLFFKNDFMDLDEEKYEYSENVVTFNTTKGSYKYYMLYNESQNRGIIAYLSSHLSELEIASDKELPFRIDKIVKLGSYDESFSQEMLQEIIAILAEEELNEKTIESYYYNIYRCTTDNSESRGYCLLRVDYDPVITSIVFSEYVGGERTFYRLSQGLSTKTYMELVNLLNTHYISEVVEPMSKISNDNISMGISILDDASHNYRFDQYTQNENSVMIAEQMISDFSEWIIKWKGKVLKVTDFEKVVVINISYGGSKVIKERTAMLVLPVDDALIELIGKYNFETYRDDYGDGSDVYD
jgi:hypothetical protein